MKLAHRFIYFFGGFTIGIIFLIFFLSGKETSCDYGMDARTLKSIRIMPHKYSLQSKQFLLANKLDSLSVEHILNTGDVDFTKSKTHLDSCNVYVVYGDFKNLPMELTITRCDSLATIEQIVIQPN